MLAPDRHLRVLGIRTAPISISRSGREQRHQLSFAMSAVDSSTAHKGRRNPQGTNAIDRPSSQRKKNDRERD